MPSILEEAPRIWWPEAPLWLGPLLGLLFGITIYTVLLLPMWFESRPCEVAWPSWNVTEQCSICLYFFRNTYQCTTCRQIQICISCRYTYCETLIDNTQYGDQEYLRTDGNIDCLSGSCPGHIHTSPNFNEVLRGIGSNQRQSKTKHVVCHCGNSFDYLHWRQHQVNSCVCGKQHCLSCGESMSPDEVGAHACTVVARAPPDLDESFVTWCCRGNKDVRLCQQCGYLITKNYNSCNHITCAHFRMRQNFDECKQITF